MEENRAEKKKKGSWKEDTLKKALDVVMSKKKRKLEKLL